ncbi:MAG: molybdopterin-dependent oxidoreductase, partial [Deltaproteobacteria bacterium]|nr:molybdopterin-dependent oxidoreductase [Deltaproteobacteria bacterium]
MSDFKILSSRAARLDAPDKATGRAVYTDDIKKTGMLYGAILHSPLAHAEIIKIDTAKALALEGVQAVITAADAPDVRFGVSPARYDETVFAVKKVLYAGDEIAAVAAVDRETALAAVDLISVEYLKLPVIAVVKKGRLESEMQDAAFLEPQSAIAEFDLLGNLTLTTSTQSVHYIQRTLSMVLGLPIDKVRVIKPYVGGGFGPKAACSSMELITCLLAKATGKPVKTTFTREQVFLHSRSRHKFFHEMEIGVDSDGKLLYLEHEALLDGGAYSSFGIATVYYAGSMLGGPYKLPNMKYDGLRAATNKPACGAQRGHGGVIARALFERLLDEVAEELGRDAIELRLINIMEAGDVTCNDLNMSSLGMRECIEAVRDGSDWQKKRGKLPKGTGIGAACGFFVSGAGYPIYRSETFHSTASVKLQEDGGGVLVKTASAEIGQGSDTAMAMIAAETIGVDLSQIRLASGDTDFGVDLGAYSSRQTLMSGHAVREAAEKARDQVLDVVAELLKVKAQDLRIEEGLVLGTEGIELDFKDLRTQYIKEHRGWTDNPQDGPLTFKEASRLAFLKRGTIITTGKYKPPELGGKFKGAAVGTSPAYGCSAQVVELAVDL